MMWNTCSQRGARKFGPPRREPIREAEKMHSETDQDLRYIGTIDAVANGGGGEIKDGFMGWNPKR